jgi:hypothetical protein
LLNNQALNEISFQGEKYRVNRLIVAIVGVFILLAALGVTAQPAAAGNCFRFSDDIGFVCDGRLDSKPEQFDQPESPEDSFLDRVQYAYMEDNINIYPEPNLASPPLYNVGEGFLYVTIQGELEVDGKKWYAINNGQYALADGIRLVTASEFRGVEIAVQPERPVGWIVQEVRPSDEPLGDPNPDYNKLQRLEFFQVYDAITADDGWIWYNIGGDRWIRQTYVSLADVDAMPEDVGERDYWVEVDLYEQTFAAYEGSRMVYAGLISSGLSKWPTAEGLFQVWVRLSETRMSGAEGKVDYYNIEDVPYTMYFDRRNEIALHGAYWHDRYGYKHSHGCVNMPVRDAEWVFNWSADAPTDLWVWVHTSDPESYFDKFGSGA